MGTLPTRMVGTYWQDDQTSNPMSDLHANVNVVYVAFGKGPSGDATSSNLVERGVATGVYSSSAMAAAVAAAQAAGKVVILSVGGQDDVIGMSGPSYTLNTTTQQTNATNSLTSLINTYGFDGIDWDLESAFKFTVTAMVNVTNNLKTTFPGLLVTLTPEHFDANNPSGMYRQVATALGSGLSLIQPQFYNGPAFTSKTVWQTQITNVTNSLCSAYGASRVAIGLEIPDTGATTSIASRDDTTSPGQYTMTTTEVNAMWDSLVTTQPNLRGMFLWNSKVDKAASYPFANTIGTHILATPGGGGSTGGGGTGGADLPPNFW